MKVVLDTNVVVSRAIVPQGRPAEIIHRWQDGEFEVFVSEPLLAEYRAVLTNSRIRARHHISDTQIADFVAGFRKFAVEVRPEIELDVIDADPDDNKLLECAVGGGVDYIVSGDSHLLDLREYQGIQVLSPAAFLLVLSQE